MFMIKRGHVVVNLWEVRGIKILREKDPTISLSLPPRSAQELGWGSGEEWTGVFYFADSSQSGQQPQQLVVTIFAVNERRHVGVCGRVEVLYDERSGRWLDRAMAEEIVDQQKKYHGVRLCLNVPVFSRRFVHLPCWLYPAEWVLNRLASVFYRQSIVFLRCRDIYRGAPNVPGGWEEVMDPQSATRPEGKEYKRRWN